MQLALLVRILHFWCGSRKIMLENGVGLKGKREIEKKNAYTHESQQYTTRIFFSFYFIRPTFFLF